MVRCCLNTKGKVVMSGMGFGFGVADIMFSAVPVIVVIGFIVVFGTMIAGLFSAAKQRRYNRSQPVLTVDAKVVSKRGDTSYHTHHHGTPGEAGHHTTRSSSTSYYATFEVESGDRMEFMVTGQESGMLVEGDTGRLTFQGTDYKGFERRR